MFNVPVKLYDATSDPDTFCFKCGHRLTKSNSWSSWECIDCHETDLEEKGVYRRDLIDAFYEYNSPKISKSTVALISSIILLPIGVFYYRKLRRK
jgi:peptide subunit release factor 1 (eRF1)